MTVNLEDFVEVRLPDPQAFLKVKETLTRIGVASKKDKTLYQSCHILHKQGHYYLVHFKEMYILNACPSTYSEEDKQRRDKIASLLEKWGFITILNPEVMGEITSEKITIIPYKEKNNYILTKKYKFDIKNSKYYVAPKINEDSDEI